MIKGLVFIIVLYLIGSFFGYIVRRLKTPSVKKDVSLVTQKTDKEKKVKPKETKEKKAKPEVQEKKANDIKRRVKDVIEEPKTRRTPRKASEKMKNIHLTIKTKSKGWLQVKVDGNIVFQSIIDKGTIETWQANEMIEISGKSIHMLEFELNGNIVGPLGRTDRKARRVIITKDGLSVKK